MGRLAKNPTVASAIAQALVLPTGTSANRPENPVYGTFRFNLSNNKLEIWNGAEWRVIGSEGRTDIVQDSFTGDGSTTVFSGMSFTKASGQETSVMVYVGNVHHNPATAYTFNGTTSISFTSPPPASHTIVILHGFDSTVAL